MEISDHVIITRSLFDDIPDDCVFYILYTFFKPLNYVDKFILLPAIRLTCKRFRDIYDKSLKKIFLTGIRDFNHYTNPQRLYLSDNSIPYLSPSLQELDDCYQSHLTNKYFTTLTSLTKLTNYNNAYITIDDISVLTNLKTLEVGSHSRFTRENSSLLTNLTSLKIIGWDDHVISNEVLGTFSNLINLSLYHILSISIEGVMQLPKLKQLKIIGTSMDNHVWKLAPTVTVKFL